MSKIFTLLALVPLATFVVVEPAHATLPPSIPEPTTLGLLAGGIAAGIVLARLRRRK